MVCSSMACWESMEGKGREGRGEGEGGGREGGRKEGGGRGELRRRWKEEKVMDHISIDYASIIMI